MSNFLCNPAAAALALLAALAPLSAFAGSCERTVLFDSALIKLGSQGAYGQACRDLLGAVEKTSERMKSAAQKTRGSLSFTNGSGQAGSFEARADLTAAGSAVETQRMKVAQDAAAELAQINKQTKNVVNRLDSDTIRAASRLQTEADRVTFMQLYRGAQNDFAAIAQETKSASTYAYQRAQGFQENAGDLGAASARDLATSERFTSGPPAPAPAPSGGVSGDTLLLVGGGALITAGAVGGLYWVSQRAISKANGAARDRINQADFAVDMRIQQAQGAANQVIDHAADTAAKIIELAVGSASQVIANAAAAATQIYNMAKSDVLKLINALRTQLINDFKLLSTAGLQQLVKEFSSLLDGLIKKAQEAGDTALVKALQQTKDTILNDIFQEIARRSGSATSVSTSTGTSTITSTATSTGSSSSTATSSNTSTASSTSSSTSTNTAAN